ncbi:MAG: ABC transporter ATP-binding protein [Treponemataceae bacterium]
MKSGLLKKFISYYKPYRKIFYFDLFCAVVVALVDLVFPQMIRFFTMNVNKFTPAEIFQLGVKVSAILLGLYIIRYGARFFITSYGHIMGSRMERDMRNDLFNHMQALSFSYYDENSIGDMLARIVSDLFDIAELAHHGPENIFIASIKLVGSFLLLSFINLKLTLILLLVTSFNLIFSLVKNKKYKTVFLDNRKKMSGINSQVQDSLAGIRVVKSFTNEEIEQEKFDIANENYLKTKTISYMEMGKYHATNNFLVGFLYVVIIFFGTLFVSKGKLSITDLTIYVLYINVYIEPINILIQFTEMLQNGISGFRRFYEIMNVAPEIIDIPNAKKFTSINESISFENVSFKYLSSDTILKDLSIKFEAGKTSALVGPSGSGKTTICSLIPRFYEVSKGAISIDGVNIKDISLKSLRENIGIVQQDVYLFGSTIAENILYGKPDATMQEIIAAAKNAHIHEFIESLPDGYDTSVGDRGVKLSGGQKQRIAIARVFLKNPPILILDEATSSLDTENEIQIQKALEALSVNRTVIVIAHRLSTIRNADTIFVITDEGLQEKGTHEELLSLNGIYASMHNRNEF